MGNIVQEDEVCRVLRKTKHHRLVDIAVRIVARVSLVGTTSVVSGVARDRCFAHKPAMFGDDALVNRYWITRGRVMKVVGGGIIATLKYGSSPLACGQALLLSTVADFVDVRDWVKT